MHKGELHAFALNLYESAKQSLARDGSVLPTKTLLLADDKKVCIAVPEGLNSPVADAVADAVKTFAPKAVGSASEAWVAPEHAHVRASEHPNRVEAIVVSVQSKDGSWCLVATFDRDEHGAPRSPSAPVASWNPESEGVYGNLCV